MSLNGDIGDIRSVFDKLRDRFGGEFHRTRSQGGKTFTYVSIDAYINRLLDVDPFAEFVLNVPTIIDNGYWTKVKKRDRNNNEYEVDEYKQHWSVALTGYIVIRGVTRYGSGADVAPDLDKAIKTAQAEVFKKAMQQFGTGLYLWTEADRNHVDAVLAGDVNYFYAIMSSIAKKKGWELKGTQQEKKEQCAAHFDIKPEEVDDVNVLYDKVIGFNDA